MQRELAESPTQQVRQLVQQLYQGHSRHVTTCRGRGCGKESEMSQQKQPFYELQLQPTEGGSLQRSLEEFLAEERLEGANQSDTPTPQPLL